MLRTCVLQPLALSRRIVVSTRGFRVTRRRQPRRQLACPHHPEARLLSCSPKRYLAAAADRRVLAGPVERERFTAWAERQKLQPLGPDAWIEQFFCQDCQDKLYWQVRRDPEGALTIHPIPPGVQAQLAALYRQLRQSSG